MKPWTEEEYARITEMWKAGVRMCDISRALTRNDQAVRWKIRQMQAQGVLELRHRFYRDRSEQLQAQQEYVERGYKERRDTMIQEWMSNPKRDPKPRKCLGCGQMFPSDWIGERQCRRCKGCETQRVWS